MTTKHRTADAANGDRVDALEFAKRMASIVAKMPHRDDVPPYPCDGPCARCDLDRDLAELVLEAALPPDMAHHIEAHAVRLLGIESPVALKTAAQLLSLTQRAPPKTGGRPRTSTRVLRLVWIVRHTLGAHMFHLGWLLFGRFGADVEKKTREALDRYVSGASPDDEQVRQSFLHWLKTAPRYEAVRRSLEASALAARDEDRAMTTSHASPVDGGHAEKVGVLHRNGNGSGNGGQQCS